MLTKLGCIAGIPPSPIRVHTTGASTVATVPKERAEHYQQGIAAIGLKVSIEPA